jgi:hypothetical protein
MGTINSGSGNGSGDGDGYKENVEIIKEKEIKE